MKKPFFSKISPRLLLLSMLCSLCVFVFVCRPAILLSLEKNRFGNGAFAKLELGMKKGEVRTLMGVPEGDYSRQRLPIKRTLSLAKEKGPSYLRLAEDARPGALDETDWLCWRSDWHVLEVMLDGEDRVSGVYLFKDCTNIGSNWVESLIFLAKDLVGVD